MQVLSESSESALQATSRGRGARWWTRHAGALLHRSPCLLIRPAWRSHWRFIASAERGEERRGEDGCARWVHAGRPASQPAAALLLALRRQQLASGSARASSRRRDRTSEKPVHGLLWAVSERRVGKVPERFLLVRIPVSTGKLLTW